MSPGAMLHNNAVLVLAFQTDQLSTLVVWGMYKPIISAWSALLKD